jgi:hypothetical protein
MMELSYQMMVGLSKTLENFMSGTALLGWTKVDLLDRLDQLDQLVHVDWLLIYEAQLRQ